LATSLMVPHVAQAAQLAAGLLQMQQRGLGQLAWRSRSRNATACRAARSA
jgi:hypothetical protein